jgi:hypothetical protein
MVTKLSQSMAQPSSFEDATKDADIRARSYQRASRLSLGCSPGLHPASVQEEHGLTQSDLHAYLIIHTSIPLSQSLYCFSMPLAHFPSIICIALIGSSQDQHRHSPLSLRSPEEVEACSFQVRMTMVMMTKTSTTWNALLSLGSWFPSLKKTFGGRRGHAQPT